MQSLILSLLLMGLSFSATAQEITPTEKYSQSLSFSDDLELEHLELAIERQIQSYDKRGGLKGTIKFGSDTYPRSILKDSLVLLNEISQRYRRCLSMAQARQCQEEFDLEINRRFHIYVPVPGEQERGFGKENTTHFTAYYSPDLTGSRTRTERFNIPIYRLPPQELSRLYSRDEIDHEKKLAEKGLEIFWVENSLFDIYLLHVQGGGRISVHLPDGSIETKYLSMTGHNGKKCEFIGHQIARMGWLPRNEALRIENQRRFLEENPEKVREAFSRCNNYIYFRESNDEPVGRDLISLTVHRSVAVDHTLYKTTGLITFVKTQKTISQNESGGSQKESFSRFFIAQDTGSKINGAARCDLYFGYGAEAEMVAYSMNDMGKQYFLVKK